MFPKLKLRRSIIFGCSSLLALPGLSSAQDAPTAKPEIEVLGERQTEAEARRDAHDYVRKTGIIRSDDPIARWSAPIVVVQADDLWADRRIVEDRVRGLAQRVGVRAADAPCRTNIIISFVTDARATARRVASRNPVTFNEVPQHARDALINGDAPVRWWYSTALGSSDGVSVAPQISGPEALGAGSEQSGWLLGVPGARGFRPSVVQTQIVRSLQSATVIVDINRAQGLPLDSVADYAAMVALAEVQPGDPPTDSLLALFANGGSQAKLTDFDLSFLKGLYDIPAARAGWQQRRMLVARIIRDAGAAGRIIASP
jgi:hypothetical protein